MTQKKTRLRIAVPVLLAICIAALLIYGKIRHTQLQPSSVVKKELDQIRTLDLSYLSAISGEKPDAPGEAALQAEAVSAFFSGFSYQVLSQQIQGDEARVLVQITNTDARSLAHDLRLLLTRHAADPLREETSLYTQDCYILLLEALQTGSYSPVSSELTILLDKISGRWQIRRDEALEDALLGGFYSSLNDPYLLDPEEVLSVYLTCFCEFDQADWMQYLKINDLFSTYSAEYAAKLDEMYTARLAECFDCQIVSCETDGDEALAHLTVTTIDMFAVMDSYRESLLEYAGTTDSITSDAATLSDTAALYLLDALKAADQRAEYPVQIRIYNNGTTWIPVFDETVTEAFLGEIPDAIASL